MELRAALEAALQAGDLDDAGTDVPMDGIPARIAREERGANRALRFAGPAGACSAVVGNLYGSRARLRAALGVADDEDLFRRLDAAIAAPRPLVPRGALGDGRRFVARPDLRAVLPALRHSAEDGAPYLTSAILVVRDPGNGRHHFCFVRMAMAGGNRLIVNPATKRMKQIVEGSLGRGEPLDAVILIGAPAEVVLLACVSSPAGGDKYEIAQAFSGGGLAFAEHAIPVPATTEVVLTGRILPAYEREGPVGDQKGLYSLRAKNPVCEVEGLWTRPDALFHAVAGGVSREHIELVTLGPRAELHRIARACPEILRFALPHFAGGRLAVLTVAEGFEPEGVLERLWKISSLRGCIAVNADVDEASAAELLWSILERARLPSQFRFSEAGHPVSGAKKFFIDAFTRKPGDWNERRIRVYEPPP